MCEISREFVSKWAEKFDEEFEGQQIGREIREWLAQQPEPKHLDKEHFIKVGLWKTPRQVWNYEDNDETLVKEATRLAYQASDERLKLHILKVLRGVGVPVASAILYFLQPDEFPVFDVRVRSSLKRAGKWERSTDDASTEAWLEYVSIMRELSQQLGVSLRDIDKALWAYDKWHGSI